MYRVPQSHRSPSPRRKFLILALVSALCMPAAYAIAYTMIEPISPTNNVYPWAYWLGFPFYAGPLLALALLLTKLLTRMHISAEFCARGCIGAAIVYILLCPLISYASRSIYNLVLAPLDYHELFSLLATITCFATFLLVNAGIIFYLEPRQKKQR